MQNSGQLERRRKSCSGSILGWLDEPFSDGAGSGAVREPAAGQGIIQESTLLCR